MTTEFGRKMVHGSLLMFIGTVIVAIVHFLFKAYLARTLTIEEYGLVFAVIAFFVIVSPFFGLGLSGALHYYIVVMRSKGEQEKIPQLVRQVVILQGSITTIALTTILVFSNEIAAWFFGSEIAVTLILLYSIYVFVRMAHEIMQSVFIGYKKIKEYVIINILKEVLLAICTIVLISANKQIISVFVAHILSSVALSLIIYFFYYRGLIQHHGKVSKVFDLSIIQKLVKYGFPLALSSITGIVLGRIDTVIITKLATLKDVGLFDVSFSFISSFWSLTAVATVPLTPLITEFWAKSDFFNLRKNVHRIYLYAVLICVPATGLVFILSADILTVIFGAKFSQAQVTMQILCFVILFRMIAKINTNLLPAVSKPFAATKSFILASILNIGGDIILIPRYGSEGAAIATLIAIFFMSLYSTYQVRKYTRSPLPYKKFFTLVSIVTILVFLLSSLKITVQLNELLSVLVTTFLFTGGYIIVVIKMNIFPVNEFKFMVGTLKNLVKSRQNK